MKISFARELTMATVNGIESYYTTVEQQIKILKDQEEKRIDRMLEGLNLAYKDYWMEKDVSMQDHSVTYDLLFTNFLRYSTMVLLFLVVEEKLHELCQSGREIRDVLAPVPLPKKSIVNQYKKYVVDDVGIDNLPWDFIHDLNKIRNCIVHKSGRIKGFKYESHVRNLTKKMPGFYISGSADSYSDDIAPLWLENDMIVLDSIFCEHAIKQVKTFFEELCDAIPLRKMKKSK